MAQVNVNFRMDEDVKKRMEQACKEMGLSMTTAFTMFATKVGNEKRIPFEISANPVAGQQTVLSAASAPAASPRGAEALLREKREQLEGMLGRVRRALTNINTAIPSVAYGMTIERIRLLCADEIKDRIAAALTALRSVLGDRGLTAALERDTGLLEQYRSELGALLAEAETLERELIPVLKAWNGVDSSELANYAGRLELLAERFEVLQTLMQQFAASTAVKENGATAVQARIRRCASLVSDPDVIAELRILEALVRRRYDALDEQTQGRMDGFYLATVERVAEELGRAQQCGEDTDAKTQLCIRAIQVVSQTITTASQMQRELQHGDLEAEVVAMERLAAMRGDITGDIVL